jgi:hypothetical protein
MVIPVFSSMSIRVHPWFEFFSPLVSELYPPPVPRENPSWHAAAAD